MLDTTQPLHRRPPPSALRELIKSEASGGIVLMVAAAAALAIANSPLAPAYFGLLKTYVGPLSVLHGTGHGGPVPPPGIRAAGSARETQPR